MSCKDCLVVCAVDTLLPGKAAGSGQNAGEVQLARRQTCKTEADVGLEDFEARAERLIDDMYGCEDAQPTGYSGLAEVDSQTCEPEETGVSSMAGNDGCENQLALMPENPDNLDVSQQAVAEAEPSCVAALCLLLRLANRTPSLIRMWKLSPSAYLQGLCHR